MNPPWLLWPKVRPVVAVVLAVLISVSAVLVAASYWNVGVAG